MTPVYAFITFWVRVGARVLYRARVRGRERIPKTGAFILAGNHVSNLDPPILGSFVHPREIHYMAKEELFSKPILGWLLPRVNAFPVNREGSAKAPLTASLKLLRGGEAVGIFPEGGRNAEGDRGVRLGMAWLAGAAQVPVVPCMIAGSGGARLFRSRIEVTYGTPIPPPEIGKASKEALAAFTDVIMRAIDALKKENDRRAD